MIKLYKGRCIEKRGPVKVYRNLHKMCFSIQQFDKVVAHGTNFSLLNAHFHVNENGRLRVLKNKRKNVHAWVRGYFDESSKISIGNQIKYNPYKSNKFTINNVNAKNNINVYCAITTIHKLC